MAWAKKKKGYVGLNTGFVASDEQLKWHKYCIDNGIIISPIPTTSDPYPEEWNIGISFMPNYRKIHKTPTVYISEIVWQETFNLMKFYYEKRTR